MPELGEYKHKMAASFLGLLYQEKGWTLNRIAEYVGCSEQTVLNHMRRFEIPRRNRASHFIGIPSHRRGKTGIFSGETIQKMREASIRRGARPPVSRGSDHWNWQGGIHEYNDRERAQVEVKKWRVAVYKRDGFSCQVCGHVGGKLNAHHIKLWSKHPELRFLVENGVTLCEPCHSLAHNRKVKVST